MSTTIEPTMQMPEPEFKTPSAEIPQPVSEPIPQPTSEPIPQPVPTLPQPVPTPAPDTQTSAHPDHAVEFADPDTADKGASVQRHGTWSKGAGASGPNAHTRTASLNERVSIASNAIDDETKGRLAKSEKKDAKRLSKIIVNEGKAEDSHLKAAIKELEGLQKSQKRAASEEVKAASVLSKASRAEQKAQAKFIEARAEHERAVATLTNLEESLKAKKEHAEKRTEMLQTQAEEVDIMRQRKAVDDREREAKLAQLREGKVVPV